MIWRCFIVIMFSIPWQIDDLGQEFIIPWYCSHALSHRYTLQWRHNDHDGVSIHRWHDCWLNRMFRRRSKKTYKLRVTGLCEGNSLVTNEFPGQRASNAENISIWWRHHINLSCATFCQLYRSCLKTYARFSRWPNYQSAIWSIGESESGQSI